MNIEKIPKQVIKGRLTPLNLFMVDSIVLHHMAHSTADVKTVESWHINKGWSAIGYNYFVSFDGTVYKGRGLNVSASVSGHNDHIISIGFQGDYDITSAKMPEKQYKAGVELIKHLLCLVPDAEIKGHKDFGGSVCPGKAFPLENFKKIKDDVEMIYDYIDENLPEWARPTIEKLVRLGHLKGDEHGRLGLNETMLKIFVINDRAGLYNN